VCPACVRAQRPASQANLSLPSRKSGLSTLETKSPLFYVIRDIHVPDCGPAFAHCPASVCAIRGRFVSNPALIPFLHMQSFLSPSSFMPHIAFGVSTILPLEAFWTPMTCYEQDPSNFYHGILFDNAPHFASRRPCCSSMLGASAFFLNVASFFFKTSYGKPNFQCFIQHATCDKFPHVQVAA
jgi:hypothetical protein